MAVQNDFKQDPDPNPGYYFQVGPGSGSVIFFPGSETLNACEKNLFRKESLMFRSRFKDKAESFTCRPFVKYYTTKTFFFASKIRQECTLSSSRRSRMFLWTCIDEKNDKKTFGHIWVVQRDTFLI